MLTSKAAKRYARAFFSLAQDKGKLDEVRADFSAIASLAAQSEEFNVLLSSPLVAHAKRLELLKSLLEGKISATSMSFITLIKFLVVFCTHHGDDDDDDDEDDNFYYYHYHYIINIVTNYYDYHSYYYQSYYHY